MRKLAILAGMIAISPSLFAESYSCRFRSVYDLNINNRAQEESDKAEITFKFQANQTVNLEHVSDSNVVLELTLDSRLDNNGLELFLTSKPKNDNFAQSSHTLVEVPADAKSFKMVSSVYLKDNNSFLFLYCQKL